MTQDEEDKMVEAMIQNANNLGPAVDMYHPDYGQILKDGKPTQEGLKFFDDILEKSDKEIIRKLYGFRN